MVVLGDIYFKSLGLSAIHLSLAVLSLLQDAPFFSMHFCSFLRMNEHSSKDRSELKLSQFYFPRHLVRPLVSLEIKKVGDQTALKHVVPPLFLKKNNNAENQQGQLLAGL